MKEFSWRKTLPLRFRCSKLWRKSGRLSSPPLPSRLRSSAPANSPLPPPGVLLSTEPNPYRAPRRERAEHSVLCFLPSPLKPCTNLTHQSGTISYRARVHLFHLVQSHSKKSAIISPPTQFQWHCVIFALFLLFSIGFPSLWAIFVL